MDEHDVKSLQNKKGLLMNPPDSAGAVGVDEKSQSITSRLKKYKVIFPDKKNGHSVGNGVNGGGVPVGRDAPGAPSATASTAVPVGRGAPGAPPATASTAIPVGRGAPDAPSAPASTAIPVGRDAPGAPLISGSGINNPAGNTREQYKKPDTAPYYKNPYNNPHNSPHINTYNNQPNRPPGGAPAVRRRLEVIQGGKKDSDEKPDATSPAHIEKSGLKRIGDYLSRLYTLKDDIESRGLHMLKGGKSEDDDGSVSARKPSGAESYNNAINGRVSEAPPAGYGNPLDRGANNQYWNQPKPKARISMRPPPRLINPLSVVVVDENPAVLLTITSALLPSGFIVRSYQSAYYALMALKEEPCNILISTVKMKQMSGLTLAEFAKTAGDAMHILLLTDRWDNSAVNYMRRDRIDGYLIKPLSKSELLDKLNAILDLT